VSFALITLFASIFIFAQAEYVVSTALITLLASILTLVQAEYVVSVALIVFPSCAICILFQAISLSCFVFIALVTTLFSTGFVDVVLNASSIGISLVEFVRRSQSVQSYK
jgi:hypothetical protein